MISATFSGCRLLSDDDETQAVETPQGIVFTFDGSHRLFKADVGETGRLTITLFGPVQYAVWEVEPPRTIDTPGDGPIAADAAEPERAKCLHVMRSDPTQDILPRSCLLCGLGKCRFGLPDPYRTKRTKGETP